ncbi:methyl-accepting chemotaxis protein [Argonema antarcticum]|uniref:methyl-accepting chemotaxis protein n=1 Tax=Argonema antarcticum TaxID=2942763 RepID=UPI0020112D3A|nr:methyl-accepting chemotaxis protein [Argonema antarcticum]MCL1470004.1 methyl-accepting chemotaxis protein [Argonema antarcticum A004/B2]
MPTTKNRLVTKLLGKVPLQAILIVPFVVQIVGVVGLVGYLSFTNGQKAIADLASKLQNEVSSRIAGHLDTLLATPRQINQINLDAYELGNLNLQDLDRTGRYFYKQMQLFGDVGYINFGSVKGEFIGIGREDNGTLYMELMRSSDSGRYKRYALDNQGKPIRVIAAEDYDFPNEDWYANAVKAGKPVWSDIYIWSDRPEIMSISSSYPLYDQTRKPIGVIGVDLILSQINSFLQTLKASPSGKIFILERDGLLVASSSSEKPYSLVEGKGQRLKVLESKDPLIRSTAQHLIDRFGNLKQIATRQQIDFNLNSNRQFVQVIPWRDKLGLDWLIVVVIPESDFMAQIDANTSTTIQLSIAALILAIIIGILTARWVTQPILQLNLAAKNIAKGEWKQTVDIDRTDVVGQLAKSFNDMASQLKHSFEKLNEVISQADRVSMKITSSTTQIAAAGKQLEATVTQQAVSTNEVSATATEIAATSEQLMKTTENIAQKAQATALAASNSQADLMEMATAMRQLATATTLISAKLGLMNEKANNINSVVTTITKVADTTNLLSLNAAIEAEKAGQYGTGFAVVAREIRRLADSTAVATVDIEQMVKEIQFSVSSGVMEMDKFSKQVSNHLERVDGIGEQITQAIEQVQSLTPHFHQVSHSMEQQFEGARQISTAISKLSESSQQTVESLQNTNQAMNQLNDTAQQLQNVVKTSL